MLYPPQKAVKYKNLYKNIFAEYKQAQKTLPQQKLMWQANLQLETYQLLHW